MRRPVLLIALGLLGLLGLLPAVGGAAPSPDVTPGATPSPDAAPQPAPTYTPPAPTYTPPAPTYTPSAPTYTPPARPRGPTAAEPGTAGADMVQASGVRLSAPLKDESSAVAPAPETVTEPVTAADPVATGPVVSEPALPELPATEAAPPPATVEAPAPAPELAAATVADPVEPAVVAAPSLPIEPSVGDGDGGGLPVDGLVLLVGLLACGCALGVRALRHGQRKIALPLLAYCAGYLLVVGGVFAGVAQAAEVADLEANPGDGEVLVTWTPPASGTVVIVAGLAPPTSCSDPAARAVPFQEPNTAAVDAGLTNGVTVYYAACVLEGQLLGDPRIVSATPVASTDGEAPPVVASLRVSVDNGRVRVRWTPPAAPDLAEIVIVRRFGPRPPATPRDGVIVYRGLATNTTDFPVSPRRRIWYSAFAIDDDENASAPTSGSLPRFDPPLYAPRDRAKLLRSTVFRWRAVRGATYYNIQIWQGAASRKVISTWVSKPKYLLRRRLPRDSYSWYVFPGFGPRSLARYGGLLGSATFTIG